MSIPSNHPALTPTKLNRIIKRFTASPNHPSKFLQQPYQSQRNLIATNANMILFLSNQLINQSITNTLIDQKGIDSLNRIESFYLTQSNFDPTTQLSLDGELITSIINSLKQHQSELRTKQTVTTLSYDSSVNEMSYITASTNYPESVSDASYFRPASIVGDRDNNFSISVCTNYLLSTLRTQDEIDGYTLINHQANKHYLQFENTYSTIVLMAQR